MSYKERQLQKKNTFDIKMCEFTLLSLLITLIYLTLIKNFNLVSEFL